MSQALNFISFNPLEFEIRFSYIANNAVEETKSAGIQISKECKLKISNVVFHRLRSMYTKNQTHIGPALDIGSCTVNIKECCFSNCYSIRSGSYVMRRCKCLSFDKCSLFQSGLWDNMRCKHPSFFSSSSIKNFKDYNISFSAREFIYFNYNSNSTLLHHITISNSDSDAPFFMSDNKHSYEIEDSNVIRALKNEYFAKAEYQDSISLKKCTFIETIPSIMIGSSKTTFSNCFFSMTKSEVDERKGNASIVNPSIINSIEVKMNPLVGKCPILNRCSPKKAAKLRFLAFFSVLFC